MPVYKITGKSGKTYTIDKDEFEKNMDDIINGNPDAEIDVENDESYGSVALRDYKDAMAEGWRLTEAEEEKAANGKANVDDASNAPKPVAQKPMTQQEYGNLSPVAKEVGVHSEPKRDAMGLTAEQQQSIVDNVKDQLQKPLPTYEQNQAEWEKQQHEAAVRGAEMKEERIKNEELRSKNEEVRNEAKEPTMEEKAAQGEYIIENARENLDAPYEYRIDKSDPNTHTITINTKDYTDRIVSGLYADADAEKQRMTRENADNAAWGDDNGMRATQRAMEANKVDDPKRMEELAWKKLKEDEQSIKEKAAQRAHELQAKTDQYIDVNDFANETYQRTCADTIAKIRNMAVEREKPKTAFEGFMRSALGTNGDLANSLTTTPGHVEAGEQAMAQWGKEHPYSQTAGMVLGMAADPSMIIGGGTGALAGKVMTNTAAKVLFPKVGKEIATRMLQMSPKYMMAQRAVQGGVNFGTFGAMSTAVNQMAHSRFDGAEILGKGMEEGLTGVFVSGAGAFIGNATDRAVLNAGSKKEAVAKRVAGTGIGLTTETAIFAGKNELSGQDTSDAWQDAITMVAGFKIPHAAKSVFKTGAAARYRPRTRAEELRYKGIWRGVIDRMSSVPETAFTEAEKDELREYGYSDLADMSHKEFASSAYEYKEPTAAIEHNPDVKEKGRTVQEPQDVNEYFDRVQQMIGDARLSETSRAKMAYVIIGKKMPMSSVLGSDMGRNDAGEYYVDAVGVNGIISHRVFDNEAAARRAQAEIDQQAVLNTVEIGERYKTSEIDNKQLNKAIKQTAAELGYTPEAVADIFKNGEDEDIAKRVKKLYDAQEGLYSIERPEGIREQIQTDYGIDVDTVIRKDADKRTEEETAALKEYVRRLYTEEQAEETQWREELPETIASNMHEDGTVHKATLYPSAENGGAPQEVFITKGDIVMREDGTVDTEASSDVVYYKDVDGNTHMASPDKFQRAEMPVSAEEVAAGEADGTNGANRIDKDETKETPQQKEGGMEKNASAGGIDINAELESVQNDANPQQDVLPTDKDSETSIAEQGNNEVSDNSAAEPERDAAVARRAELEKIADYDGNITPITVVDKKGNEETLFYKAGNISNKYGGIFAVDANGNVMKVRVADIVEIGETESVEDLIGSERETGNEEAQPNMEMAGNGGSGNGEVKPIGMGVQQNGDVEQGNQGNETAEVPSNDGRGSGSLPTERQAGVSQNEEQVTAALSENEVDEYDKPFVLAQDGSTTFGIIDADSGLTEAPIKLSIGENYVDEDGNNHGYGLIHIDAEHGEQIKAAGYNSIEEFVEEVAKNYTDIREGSKIGEHQTYLLEVTDEHNNTLFIQLSNDGTYWNVNSAGIFRKRYSRRKPKVFTVPAVGESTSTDTSEVDSDHNEGAIAPAGNSLMTSDGKVTESSATEQGNVENSADNQQTSEQPTTAEAVKAAEQEVNTNPTEAQKEAGNYKKGHVKVDGYDITIEQPKGSVRRGTDADGKSWESEMHNTYGYIRGTEGTDGDHIDVFLSDNPEEGNVYVIDQVNPKTGDFDEHKVMYGFNTMEEAREAYLSNYSKDWKGLGNITEVNKDEFKKWIDSSHRKTKPFAEYKSVKPTDETTNEEQRKRQARANLAKARETLKKKGRYSKENAELGDYTDFRDYAMRTIATGGLKLRWSDDPDTPTIKGLASHLGMNGSQGEQRKRIWLLSKDGLSPEAAAESLVQGYKEDTGYGGDAEDLVSTQEALNEILDIVGGYDTPRAMFDAAKERHFDAGEKSYEKWLEEQYGLRFREVEDADGEKSLVGIHNITEDKLRKALRMGGLANPSSAVIDVDKQSHQSYGEISLIMPSSMVDKRTGKNAGTWSQDAYTPMYPQVQRRFKGDGSQLFTKDVSKLPSEMQSAMRNAMNEFMDGRDAHRLSYMFLHERGEAPETVRKESRYSETTRNAVKKATDGTYSVYTADKKLLKDTFLKSKGLTEEDYDKEMEERRQKYEERIKELSPDSLRYKKMENFLENLDEFGFDISAMNGFLNDVYYDSSRAGKANDIATTEKADQYIREHDLQGEFDKWLDGLNERYGIEEVLFNGYTPSGTRRYLPHTLENVSKMMKKQGRNGATGIGSSFQNFAASVAKPKGKLSDIRKEKGKLTNDHGDLDKFREKWQDVYYELGQKCQPGAQGFEDYGFYRLAEAAKENNPKKYLKDEYGVGFTDEDVRQLNEMVEAIRNDYPAMYFETKFERPVKMDEFAAAVVPDNTDREIVEAMEKAGLPVFTYKAGDEAARAQAVRDASLQNDKIRFRFIGEQGAARLDKAEEKTERMDGLKVAKEMEKAMKPEDVKEVVIRLFNEVSRANLSGRSITIGQMTEEGLKALHDKFGIDFRQGKVRFVLNPSDMMHVYDEHFGSNETDERNIPLTEEDIKSVVDVIYSPNDIIDLGIDPQTQSHKFAFLKDADNGCLNLVEVLADKNGVFTAKTFYKTKKKASQRINELLSSSHSTSKKRSDSLLSGANIPQMFENRKPFSPNIIKIATGWERGTDGKWRYEQPDFKEFDPNGGLRKTNTDTQYRRYQELIKKSNGAALLGTEALSADEKKELDSLTEQYAHLENSKRKGTSLSELADYVVDDALFAAYPELAELHIEEERLGGGERGYYENSIFGDRIVLDSDLMERARNMNEAAIEEARSVLIHEVQHAIQQIEGFAVGGNLEAGEKIASEKMPASEVYHRLAGEVEARNAQSRKDMTDEERRNSLASETEDVPREEQIILNDGGEMRKAVESEAERLRADVEYVEKVSDIEDPVLRKAFEARSGRKAVYDGRNGKMIIVGERADDADDAVGSVLHEALGHDGLRKYVGEEAFNDFLDKVYDGVTDEVRKAIDGTTERMYKGDRRQATEEHIAHLADDPKAFDEFKRTGLWEKIKGWLKDMLTKARLWIGRDLTDRDLLYLLWRTDRLRSEGKGAFASPMETARDMAMRNRLHYGENREKAEKYATEPIRDIEEANNKFNKRLQQLADGAKGSRRLSLGHAGNILRSAGIVDAEVVLDYDKVVRKGAEDYKNFHPFRAEDLKDLPKAINAPLAVFESSSHEGDKVILTEMRKDGKNFIVAVRTKTEPRRGGKILEINEITTLYPKDAKGVISWINNGKGIYYDKEKAPDWLGLSQPHADSHSNQELISAANIVKNFENPSISEENISSDDDIRFKDDDARDPDRPRFGDKRRAPRKKKGETMGQFLDRLRTWEKNEMGKEAAARADDPTPSKDVFDRNAQEEYGKAMAEWRKANDVPDGEDGVGTPPRRKEGESPQDYAVRVADYESRLDKWKGAPDMFKYMKKADDEYRKAYEEWKRRYDIEDEASAANVYGINDAGKARTEEDHYKELEAERRMDTALAQSAGVDTTPEGAKRQAKAAKIYRRKDMESMSAEDALFIQDLTKRMDKQEKSAGLEKGKLREAMPYLIEADRRRNDIAKDFNESQTAAENHVSLTADDIKTTEPYTARLRSADTRLKEMQEKMQNKEDVNPFDLAQAMSERAAVATDMAKALNEAHAGDEDWVAMSHEFLESTAGIVSRPVLPRDMAGIEVTPEIQKLMDEIGAWYDEFYGLIEDVGLRGRNTGRIQNGYVNHVWDKERSDPQAYAQYVENYQRTKSPNMRQRSISTYMEGVELGLAPKFDDMSKLLAYYSRSNIEAICNKRFLDDLSFINVDEVNKDGEVVRSLPLLNSEKPDEFDRDRYAQYYVPGVGDVYVAKEVKQHFDSVFGELRTAGVPDWVHSVGKGYDIAASTAKKIQLSFSGFHAGALTEVALAQMRPDKGLQAVLKYVIYDSLAKGTIPAYAHPEDFKDAAKHLVQLGATQDYAAADVNALTEKLRALVKETVENAPVALKAAGKPLEWTTVLLDWANKGMDKMLWNYLHDGLKIAAFRNFREQIEARCEKEGIDDGTKEKLLDEAGQYVNDCFGGQFWELLNVTPAQMKWMRRMLLSPDWLVSTQRHFAANFGFGSVWSDGGFREYLKYNSDNIKRAFGKDIAHDELRRFRSSNAKKCYIFGVCVFFYATMNALNAFNRWRNVQEEKEKAEEMRKTNPDYKSPYELAYPDGMKWYDYTMWGNAMGQQTHLFNGRYEDGSETYLRWGKQFREFPEMFIGRKGFDFPTPMIERFMGKANPMVGTAVDLGGALDLYAFNTNQGTKEIQAKYGKQVAALAVVARHYLPFSVPTQADKEFKMMDLVMPSQKGFTRYKTVDYFKDFVRTGDMDGIARTYQAAVMNGVDAKKCLEAAIATVKAEQKEELRDGVGDLPTAFERYDKAHSLTEKKTLKTKIEKLLAADKYEVFTKQEAMEKVLDFVNGEEDVPKKENEKYLMRTTASDIRDDYRLNCVGKTAREYVKKVKAAKDSGNGAWMEMRERYGTWFEIDKTCKAAKRKINKLKKLLGTDGNDDAATMEEIRRLRREAQEAVDGLEPIR